jgi:ketosteroid isomerase-like protein
VTDLADQLALTQLTARYAATVDGRDWDGLAELFASDAVLVTPGSGASLGMAATASGREEIVAAVRQIEAFARTFHHLTGSVWTVTGSTAAGRTTCVAHHVEEGPEPRSWAWHVIYEDRCVRDESGWRFERRELTVAMVEARPMTRVLPFAAPAGP